MTLLISLSALAALSAPGQPADHGAPPARPAISFEKHAEFDCDWVMRDAAAKSIRGSIGRGEQSPVLHIVDSAFKGWSEVDDPTLALSAGGRGGRVQALAYVIHSAAAGPSLNIFLDEKVRGVVGRARKLEIWKDGKLQLTLTLTNTPTARELAACVSEGD